MKNFHYLRGPCPQQGGPSRALSPWDVTFTNSWAGAAGPCPIIYDGAVRPHHMKDIGAAGPYIVAGCKPNVRAEGPN